LFSKQFILNFLEELFILILSVIIDMAKKAKKRNWKKEYEEAVKYWDWVFSLPKDKQDEIFYEMLEKSSKGA